MARLFNQPLIAAAFFLLGASATLVSVAACGASPSQEITTVGVDSGRSGWAQNAGAIGPDSLQSFGARFTVKLVGSVMGQPLVHAGAVYAGTNQDSLYRIDARTGAVIWHRSLGHAEPAGAGQPFDCADVTPSLGILSTPVIDTGSGRIYVITRNWDGSSPQSGTWVAHALRLEDGAETPGWPVTLEGASATNPADRIESTTLLQRAALLIAHGRLWIAFAGACDRYPFRGWLASIGLGDRALALWPLSPSDPAGGAGIWQSGGGPADDGTGHVLVSTGDSNPNPGPRGRNPLAQCVLRLDVTAATPTVADSFCPANGAELDQLDLDVGTGNPLPLPFGFGAPAGKAIFQVSKDGVIYLLNRDHLGTALAQSPGHEPMLSRPAAWPGDGFVFVTGTQLQPTGRPPSPDARLRAYRVRAGSAPSVELAATAPEPMPYGSGSPLVTSDAKKSGSALVWVVARQDPQTNRPAELRAYEATPSGTRLVLRFERLIGSAPKFNQPATDGQRIYVATESSDLLAFGPAPTPPIQGSLVLALASFAGMVLIVVVVALRLMRR